jgi:AraC-like DNA-binding protein
VGGTSLEAREHASAAPFDVVHADLLRFFPDLVTELGGDAEDILRSAGLSADSLSPSKSNYRRFVTLLEHAAISLHCADFGLRLAMRQGATSIFGPLGTVMRNSNTLGEALAYAQAHTSAHSLAARIRIEPRRETRDVFVGHDILVDGLPSRRQAIEQVLLLGQLNAMEVTGGRARVREVHFRHQPLSSPRLYRRYFGCEVRFDQQEDGVVFSERDLACAITEPDPKLCQITASLIDATFADARQPMHAQVRGVILQLLGAEACSNERVAEELGLHPRTLHRRLKDEGASFQSIKDAVRRDLALSYLTQTDLDLTQIAQRLGYAEHSVFTRSCARWFAQPPSEMRAHAREAAS